MPCPIFPHSDTSQNTCFCTEYLNAPYEVEIFNGKNGASMACPIFPHNDTSQNMCFCTEYLNAHYEDKLFNSRWDKSCTMQLNVRLYSHLYGVSSDGVHNKEFHSRMPSGYHNQHQLGTHRARRRR
jgi:hypothetical protein